MKKETESLINNHHETRTYLVLLIAAALLNTMLEGTANLVVIIMICLALVPVANRMDKEAQKKKP